MKSDNFKTIIAFLCMQLGRGFLPCATREMKTTTTTSLKMANRTTERRSFLIQTSTLPIVAFLFPGHANAISKDDFINDLKTSKTKLAGIPELLDQNEWDKVRTILKTPPINFLWNLGDAKNPLVQYAKESGDFELLEMKDELSVTLQMCDQLTYDNAFVYFQPGNGKLNIKEPKQLAMKAMDQIQDAINVVDN
jgi:hypothetical protein